MINHNVGTKILLRRRIQVILGLKLCQGWKLPVDEYIIMRPIMIRYTLRNFARKFHGCANPAQTKVGVLVG